MIPTFPQSKPLELADRHDIERFTRRFDPYSDYRFPSLWCWDSDGECRISTLHGNLVVRFQDYLSGIPHYGFLGMGEVRLTARTLIAAARAEGLEPRLRLVPEAVVAADERLQCAYAIVDDPANFDYVCSVRDWVDLPGKPYARHRTRIRHCLRHHVLEAHPLALDDPSARNAMLALCDRWAEGQGTGGDVPRRERAAVERLFMPGVADGMAGCGLYEAGELRAFSIWEYVPHAGGSVHHFMKADRACQGAASVMVHVRARVLLEAGCRFANIEQDLGLPGLTEFKRSLRPCGYLRKVAIAEHDAPSGGEG